MFFLAKIKRNRTTKSKFGLTLWACMLVHCKENAAEVEEVEE